MSLSRQSVLSLLIFQNDWKRGAELGVYEGATFLYLLERFPTLELIGVDKWERTPGPKDQDRETGQVSYANKDMEGAEKFVREQCAVFNARAKIIKADTVKAAKEVADSSLDFVFIDADHTTASVKADIKAWQPKVKAGGMLLGHDRNWPSVQKALAALFGPNGWKKYEGNVWARRC